MLKLRICFNVLRFCHCSSVATFFLSAIHARCHDAALFCVCIAACLMHGNRFLSSASVHRERLVLLPASRGRSFLQLHASLHGLLRRCSHATVFSSKPITHFASVRFPSSTPTVFLLLQSRFASRSVLASPRNRFSSSPRDFAEACVLSFFTQPFFCAASRRLRGLCVLPLATQRFFFVFTLSRLCRCFVCSNDYVLLWYFLKSIAPMKSYCKFHR